MMFGFGEEMLVFHLKNQMNNNQPIPFQSDFVFDSQIKQICSGNSGTLILTSEGKVISISTSHYKKELEVKNAIKISIGFTFGVILTENSEVYCVNPENEKNHKNWLVQVSQKGEIGKIVDLVCGLSQYYLLNEKGDVFHLRMTSSYDKKEFIDKNSVFASNVRKIFAGNYAYGMFYVTKSNELFVYGSERSGNFGIIPSSKSGNSIQKVEPIPSGEIENVVMGFEHSVMLVRENGIGQLYSCGSHDYNGLGLNQDTYIFTRIDFFADENVLCFDVADNLEKRLESKELQFLSRSRFPGLSNNLQNYIVCTGAFNSFIYYSTRSNLASDLIDFFENQEGCDLHFNSINGKISCHQIIIDFRIGRENTNKLHSLIRKSSLLDAKKIMHFIYGAIPFSNEEHFQEISQMRKFPSKNHQSIFYEDLLRMFQDEKSKDFTINVQNHPIKVHKVILWARTQVFRGMFLHVHDETNQVTDYSEISLLAFNFLLYYLYNDRIDPENAHLINNSILEELTKAMDFFQLNEAEPNLVTKVKKILDTNKKAKRK
ncbi:hypothetical protein M0811_08977 [Anaeramoeba ignava]|uniref:BTB domain-containing protein n=1 Tax=Anaeramoeba ignava TaxID=1746090 RepID=A0A9Q0LHK8_ANAIG|nr:hypothetical protein M0811_08977 [Anaeramoeba ignava]